MDLTPNDRDEIISAARSVSNIAESMEKIVDLIHEKKQEDEIKADTFMKAAAYCEFLLTQLPSAAEPFNAGRADALKRVAGDFEAMAYEVSERKDAQDVEEIV
ncbi:MAG: hypothetical protein ABIH23_16735 [bacterium]